MIAIVAATAACGGSVAVDALDGSAGDARDEDNASASDDASDNGDAFGGFVPYDGPSLSMAQDKCDPPCGPGEFCYAFVSRGGGRRPTSPDGGGDDAAGCNAIPTACTPQATCACLVAQVVGHVGRACNGTTVECVLDDAGRPTVECILVRP